MTSPLMTATDFGCAACVPAVVVAWGAGCARAASEATARVAANAMRFMNPPWFSAKRADQQRGGGDDSGGSEVLRFVECVRYAHFPLPRRNSAVKLNLCFPHNEENASSRSGGRDGSVQNLWTRRLHELPSVESRAHHSCRSH